jgi:hypothetical protein
MSFTFRFGYVLMLFTVCPRQQQHLIHCFGSMEFSVSATGEGPC